MPIQDIISITNLSLIQQMPPHAIKIAYTYSFSGENVSGYLLSFFPFQA
jgi:hypothetical protein